MIYDEKKRKVRFESPEEQEDYLNHMKEFGPVTKKSHPDDCPYCAMKGWKTFPGTTFEEVCDMIEAAEEAEDAEDAEDTD